MQIDDVVTEGAEGAVDYLVTVAKGVTLEADSAMLMRHIFPFF
jgi:hypothetical protein